MPQWLDMAWTYHQAIQYMKIKVWRYIKEFNQSGQSYRNLRADYFESRIHVCEVTFPGDLFTCSANSTFVLLLEALYGKSIHQTKTTKGLAMPVACWFVSVIKNPSIPCWRHTYKLQPDTDIHCRYPNGLYHLQVDLQLEDCVHLMKGFQVLLHAAVPLPATALLCSFAQAAMHLELELLFYLSLPLQALHSWL